MTNVINLDQERRQRRGPVYQLREQLRAEIERECYIQGFGLDDEAMNAEIDRRVRRCSSIKTSSFPMNYDGGEDTHV